MSSTWTVARKELRTTFQSPVAVLFLAVFLLATLLWFFSGARFFARNLADVRPLFEALPILLVFLVSAITMRAWAEEEKSGTLEVLLTLPLRTRDLVLGKFLAGLVLVGLALALTLPLPITVSMVGDLDWGPVVGGYVGALLLASAYMAIGLCVSARTDNQVVALLVTLVLGGALWALGSDRVTALVGTGAGEVLRALGTGSRFASIERGVLDLRDLVYYASLTAFFLVLNGYFLERRRLDVTGEHGRRRHGLLLGAVALVGLNAIAANVWLAPVTALRADLTERGEYSVSQVTRDTLAGLAEPLRITGYFSERTHPLLSPLVPQIRDLLAEYETYGGGRVDVSYADPNADEELKERLANDFGIQSVPFQVTDRNERAIVNAYFHVLVEYGDEYEVLSFDELIEIHADEDGIDVRLKGLEYDLTKAIRRVSQDFESLESIFAKLPEQATLTAYLTPETLPAEYGDLATTITTVAEELVERSGGRMTFEVVDPLQDPQLQETLAASYGIRPFAVDLFGREVFYAHLLFRVGDEVERLVPQGDVTEADLREALESAISRAAPGQLKRVAILTEQPEAPAPDPNLPPQFQPPPPQADYRALEQALSAEYDVRTVDLMDGQAPADVDILVVAKPGRLDDEQQFAIDQFLMRGGAVIALAGHYKVDATTGTLDLVENDARFEDLLEAWGVTVEDALVFDPQAVAFPFPTGRRGLFGRPEYQLVDFAPMPDIRPDGMNRDHPVTSNLGNVTAPFASPLTVSAPEGVTATVLLETSERSWASTSPTIEPDFQRYPGIGFPTEGEVGRKVVGVALSGVFPSAFTDRDNPLWDVEGEGDRTGRTLKTSMPDARLVVLGSSEMVSDLIVEFMGSGFGEAHRSNLQLFQNLLDWSMEDTDLLSIRTSGAFARTLRPLSDGERSALEVGNYVVVLGLLGVVVAVSRRRRPAPRPPGAAAGRSASTPAFGGA